MNSMAIQTNCTSIDLDSVLSSPPLQEPASPSLLIKPKMVAKRMPYSMSIEESTARIAEKM
jgi:hypothetical protein